MTKLFRVKGSKAILGGVLAGLSEITNIDVTILRVLAIGGFFTPVPVVFLYILFWAIMPVKTTENYSIAPTVNVG